MKFLIKLVGLSRSHGSRKAGGFIYNRDFGAHLWGGHPLPIEEFASTVPDVLENYKDYMARLPVVEILFEDQNPEKILAGDPLTETNLTETRDPQKDGDVPPPGDEPTETISPETGDPQDEEGEASPEGGEGDGASGERELSSDAPSIPAPAKKGRKKKKAEAQESLDDESLDGIELEPAPGQRQ